MWNHTGLSLNRYSYKSSVLTTQGSSLGSASLVVKQGFTNITGLLIGGDYGIPLCFKSTVVFINVLLV